MVTTERKKLYVNKLTDSIQLTSLLFAPIFSARPPKYDEEKIVEINLKRTKTETIYYKGRLLDTIKDFPLFSLLVSKLQKINQNLPEDAPRIMEFEMTEVEVFKTLGVQIRKSNIDLFEKRLDKFKASDVCIKIFNDDQVCIRKLKTSLVLKYDWKKENKIIRFTMDHDFLPKGKNSTDIDREFIDLRVYDLINTGYAKSLFLYLETKKFSEQEYVRHVKESLINRIAMNVKTNRERNRALTASLEELVRVGYLKKYYPDKSKDTYEPVIMIARNPKFMAKVRADFKKIEEEEAKDAELEHFFK
jgi:hypothetical protein